MRTTPLLFLLALGCRSTPPSDVIFITIDTLRVDHVGAYSEASPAATPHMDRLAEMGTVYTQAYSPISVTGPAFVTLHTGQDPDHHGVRMNSFRGGNQLSYEAETLADRLNAEGYRNGAFVSGFTLRKGLGLEQGFHKYSAPEKGETRKSNRRDGAKTAQMANRWISDRKGPIFMWFHTYDVHGPLRRWSDVSTAENWEREPENLGQIPNYQQIGGISDPDFYVQRYADAVEYVDQQVGTILDTLEESGRLENAIIVLTADHGESFMERDLWFDHGTHATEEQLHVPLLIRFPQGYRGGTQADELVGLMDLAPTVLEVLGLEPLGSADGVSLESAGAGHAVLMGESSHCKGKQEVILDCTPHGVGGKELAARSTALTVIHESEADDWIVYDRETDPTETHRIEEPEVPEGIALRLQGMRSKVVLLQADSEALEMEPISEEEQETQEQLEALGYTE